MRSREVVRRIEALGGVMTRQVGSHRRYKTVTTGEDGNPTTVFTTVPVHNGDIPNGTLRAIQKDLEPAFGKGWLL